MKKRRIITALFSLTMAFFIAPSMVSAADNEIVLDIDMPQVEEITPDAPDGDELFEQYFDRVFYGADQNAVPSLRKGSKLAADGLGTVEKNVYNYTKDAAKNIADGKATYAEAKIPLSAFGIETDHYYTPAELGLDYIVDSSNKPNPNLNNAIANTFFSFDRSKVLSALYSDCPYEFYWQRGSFNFSTSFASGDVYAVPVSGTYCLRISAGHFSVKMTVDPKYRASSDDIYTVDTSKTGAALTAVNNAKAIVQNAKSKSDYNKLVYYKDQICSLVTYDNNAAQNGDGSDGGPWAMIYVFDNNANTNVVCEGYMEAFQYLCDQTAFDSKRIYSISVRGTLNGTGHGWNVVHMNNDRNYIADVTNSDSSSVGNGGELFLKGMTATSNGYKKTIGSITATYEYDANTRNLFTASELAVSSADFIYEESHQYGNWTIIKEPTCLGKGLRQGVCSKCGDITEEEVAAAGHTWGNWTYLNETQHQRVCEKDSSHVETGDHTWEQGKVTKAPTCTEPGAKVFTCSVCEGTKTEAIPALTHSWGAWTAVDENQHQRICKHDSSHFEKAAHTWNNGEVTKAPTCTEPGIKKYSCTVCGATKTEAIDPIGHKWGNPVYEWAADNSAATATRICGNDPTHVESETVETTSAVTKAATYTAKGETTYTAAFANKAFWSQTKTVANIPKLAKKSQPMKVTATAKTVKVKILKKKSVTVAPITVKNSKGIVIYKVVSGSAKAKKALKLNKTNGKITVKRLTKKGIYTIKVRVSAAGTTVYKAGNQTVLVTIKVK